MTKHESKKIKFGRIFKKWNTRPDGTRVDSATWTVRYKGKDYPTGESEPKKAERFLLNLATGAAAQSKPKKGPVGEEETLMAELLDGVVANAKRRGNATARENAGRVDLHLRPFFDHIPAAQVTSKLVDKYADERIELGASPATVNKELAILKRCFNVELKGDDPLISRRPHINMLKVQNVRKGFLTHQQYVLLKQCLPAHVVPVLIATYHVGNRKGELLQVELKDIDMDAPQPQFRLYPDATKSGKGRTIPIYGEMVAVFKSQIEITRRDYPRCTWLFHNQGKPFTFRRSWLTATTLAGVPDLLFHDLRRTAVRNLIRAGVSRKVAMAITGHKTESVFDRYDITDEADIQGAADKMTTYLDRAYAQMSPSKTLIS